LHADAIKDVSMYIHRVGRTARVDSRGRALLFVLPPEKQALLAALEKAKVVHSPPTNPSLPSNTWSMCNAE
jgi:ATP-dependent RNA helicase DDX10/DBP4